MFELRAYNASTGQPVTRTYVHLRKKEGWALAATKKHLARPVSDQMLHHRKVRVALNQAKIQDGRCAGQDNAMSAPTVNAVAASQIQVGMTVSHFIRYT
jgi:hypothetical protein